jgi:hypothetical protein
MPPSSLCLSPPLHTTPLVSIILLTICGSGKLEKAKQNRIKAKQNSLTHRKRNSPLTNHLNLSEFWPQPSCLALTTWSTPLQQG